MKHLYLTITLILQITIVHAQWYNNWTSYTDDGTNGNYYHHTMLTDDQGYIYCLGKNKASTNVRNDIMIVKYDTSGSEIWSQIYSRSGDRTETIQGATIDHNGDLIFTGECFNTSNIADVLIAKYSSSGQLLWSDSIDGSSGMYDKGFSVCVDDSNNIYVTGYLYNASFKGFLAKYSSSGQQQFLITFPYLQQGNGIQYKNNRLFLYGITGASGSPAHTEIYKLSLNGAIQNSYLINDAYSNRIASIIEKDQNIYLIDNRGAGSIGYSTYSVHCLDTSFNFIWKSDQIANNHLEVIDITEHDSSVYVSSFHTISSTLFHTEIDLRRLSKIDGALTAQNTFSNSSVPMNYYAHHVSNSQGNLSIGMMSNGNSSGNFLFQIAEYDKNLQYLSLVTLPDSVAGGDVSILQPNDHEIYFAAQTLTGGNDNDLMLAKFSDIQVGIPITDYVNDFYLFPNPCKNEIYINPSISGSYKWQIINELGQLVNNGSSDRFGSVSTCSLESGIYYFRIIHSKGLFSKSILKINE